MHGLILAAGEGSRLRADGVLQPKSLVEIGGQPQVLGLVDTFRELGCESVTCMVPAERADAITALRTAGRPRGPAVIGCRTPSSLHTLALGLASVPSGRVFCSMVDTVMRPEDWARLWDGVGNDLAAGADLVLAVTPYVDDERPLYVGRGPGRRVVGVGEAPAEPVVVTGGVYGLSPAARRAAQAAPAEGCGRMREFLQRAIRSGLVTTAVEVDRIIDVDRGRDLAAANAWLAATDAPASTPTE